MCICWGTIKPWSNWNMEKTNWFNNTGRIWSDGNGMSIMIARRTILYHTRDPYSFNWKNSVPICQNVLSFQTKPKAVTSKTCLVSCPASVIDSFCKIKPFVPNTPLLFPLTVFWCLQGAEKGCTGNKWFKSQIVHHILIYMIYSESCKVFPH